MATVKKKKNQKPKKKELDLISNSQVFLCSGSEIHPDDLTYILVISLTHTTAVIDTGGS